MPEPNPSQDDEEVEEVPIKGPVKIEQGFQVDGQKLTVLVTLPAQVAEAIGMDNAVVAANRAIVTIESSNHDVKKIRRTDVGP